MNRLELSERAAIIRGLVEGGSVRAVARINGVQKNTVLRLLSDVGEFCGIYQDYAFRRLAIECVEADEVWGFCGAKERNARQPGHGDLWTYTAICADSKLLFSWLIGPRSKYATRAFIRDLGSRIAGRFQLSTDGLKWYEPAVRAALAGRCDYAQIIKTFGSTQVEADPSRRYSPAVCTGIQKYRVMGNPDLDRCSTSYVERNNLSIRTSVRRMTRLTNGFSKTATNHAHAFALHAMHFNYCRPHGTLTREANGTKTTPAMAAGLSKRVWTIEDVLARMEPRFVTL